MNALVAANQRERSSAGFSPMPVQAAMSDELDEDGLLVVPQSLLKVQKLLLRLVEAAELPANPLDQLTDLLGGEENVAEMTGRKGMLKKNAEGKVVYAVR